ncbi:MAG: IcmT/TraK family protein [Desulfovibrio sp.]|nr:IcmT/TraK family protein [Desulfovibrio sp.]
MRQTGLLWRDTARPVRIGFLDARAASGFGVFLLHMSWPTFWLSLLVLALFALIDRFGVTPPAALRWCRQACVKPLRLHYSPYCVRRTTL